MYKLTIFCLSLISIAANADNSPTYDFNSGLLTLPFINTQQGTYSAQLQIGPNAFNAQPVQFKVTSVSSVSDTPGINQSPSYNFNSGLLTIPYVSTQQGYYTANLQLTPASPASNPMVFNLTRVNTYIAPRFNKIQTCTVFPADNVWNTPVNTLAVHRFSNAWVNAIGNAKGVHMDFGSGTWDGGTIGIPYNILKGSTASKSAVTFLSQDESDAGPYPIPNNYKIEYGSDRHLLLIDNESCQLYELFNARYGNGWMADSGATWQLHSNQLRPSGWTSADAAGLPIFPGLIRYDEVASGFIGHAIRFTIPSSKSYVWPARHLTGGMVDALTDTPPLGARFRLKASYDISGFAPELQVILKAMQTFGVISADHGSGWYMSGEPDERWDNESLKQLGILKGSDFEAVETACMMVNANSGQADLSKCQ